ncbi:MAG: uroporphyrinogen decarboxylase [Alphaproteobacteria bacterium]|nr:uroporphyrinogen decarboxylase [Alphaproteobacteria bacterium]
MRTLEQTFNGKATSPPPIWLMRQAGRYLPEYRAVREQAGSFMKLCGNPQLASEVTLQPVKRFGLDAAIIFSDILLIPHALGRRLDFAEGEGPRLDPLPEDSGAWNLVYDEAGTAPTCAAIKTVRAALGNKTSLIGFCGAPWTVACYMIDGKSGKNGGFARALQWAQEKPDLLTALSDQLCKASAQYLIAQISAGAGVLQIFDSWAGLLAHDEALFTRFVTGPAAKITAEIKRHYPEIPVIGFPRGARGLYGRYAAASGADAIGIDSDVSLAAARKLQQDRPVQGNLRPEILLEGGGKLVREVASIMEALAGGPFIFNLGHGILPATPPDHVAQLVDLVRNWKA